MKASNIRVGDLIKTNYGLATVMKFFAPSHIGCVIIAPYTKNINMQLGDWIYLRGLDLQDAKVIR